MDDKNEMKKITINDVANHAGVSKKTISRVLNNEPNVSSDTKSKVRASFKTLGYRPNPHARGLASNQSFLIGLLYDNPNKSYVSDIQNGALERCKADGYNLIIHPEDHDNDGLLVNVENVLTEANLDGVILTPPFSDMVALLDLLQNKKIPFVRIGATLPFTEMPAVISNDTEASYQMCRYLISLGHTQIGFIKGHPDHHVSQQRLDGYLQALSEIGISPEQSLIKQGYFTFESGESCARQLLSLNNRPTAIFASNDFMAAGVLKVALQKHLSVPHDLSVTGYDNAPISRYIWPSLTTVKQPIKAMAVEATKVLIKLIRNKTIDNDTISFENELVVRESSAPSPRKESVTRT